MAERLGEALLELGTDDRKLLRWLGRAESLTLKTVDRFKTIFAGVLKIRGARRAEVELDAAIWTILPERTKSKTAPRCV